MDRPNSLSSDSELYEFQLARERFEVAERYRRREIRLSEALLMIGVGRAQFFRILKRIDDKGEVSGAKRYRRGRKSGSISIAVKLEKIIDEKFEKHYKGRSATYAEVWRQVQAATDAERISCPSYHTIVRWIKENKKQRDRDLKKLGAESTNQLYGSRPGRYIASQPLEWVQMDHTRLDAFVVDDEDPTIIIGRPWVSFAIDVYTRAIVGFHLSLLPPSSMTVAMLVANAVLPKDKMLQRLGLTAETLVMHGLMKTIHTDNAKEFVSKLLLASCDVHGIKVKHRDIGKKHQGGHIERLIGTIMTTRVHFYRGTTYSNPVKRRGQSSEKKSCLTFKDMRALLIHAINGYHGVVHSALRDTPLNVWNNYFKNHESPKLIEGDQADKFRIDFYPEKIRPVHPSGIKMLGREYWGGCLRGRVRDQVLVKYDPYDASHVKVLLDDEYVDVQCSHNKFGRSDDFEYYRYQRANKGIRPGTIMHRSSRASVRESNDIQDKAAKRKEDIRRSKKHAAKREHLDYKNNVASSSKVAAKPVEDLKNSPPPRENYLSFLDRTPNTTQEFSDDPVIFDAHF